jgi:hypothetical protein
MLNAKHITIFALAILLPISVASAGVDSSVADGIIYGHVYDAKIGEAISGAFVLCEGEKDATDAEGYYAIEGGFDPSTSYTVTCYASGCPDSSKTVETGHDGNAKVDFYLGSEPAPDGNPDDAIEYADTMVFFTPSEEKSTAFSEIMSEINEKIDIENPIVRNKAVMLAAKYPGEYTIDQIASIYDYLKDGWVYVCDPRGTDYYSPASEILQIGAATGHSGAGDCDDFAILMSALIEAVGGNTRIILAYDQNAGHAYTEVYLGQIDNPDHRVEDIINWLKSKYNTDEIYTHVDPGTHEVWLNLDWSADHPGGPFYKAENQAVLAERGGEKKYPLNI